MVGFLPKCYNFCNHFFRLTQFRTLNGPLDVNQFEFFSFGPLRTVRRDSVWINSRSQWQLNFFCLPTLFGSFFSFWSLQHCLFLIDPACCYCFSIFSRMAVRFDHRPTRVFVSITETPVVIFFSSVVVVVCAFDSLSLRHFLFIQTSGRLCGFEVVRSFATCRTRSFYNFFLTYDCQQHLDRFDLKWDQFVCFAWNWLRKLLFAIFEK